MTESAGTIVSPHWSHLDVAGLRGTVMIIGPSDSGKSTLARYLHSRLCQTGVRAAYLDGDVGQSTLGLPTTMVLAVAARAGDDSFPPRGPAVTYFVGSTTPRGFMLPTVVGSFRLREKALALGAETVIVDTTGLVDAAEGGRALKQYKIELLAPSLLIALQRGRELEPLLWPLRRSRRVRVLEWPVSPHVLERSREARIARRRAQLARYFEPARPVSLALHKMAVYELDRLVGGALLAFEDAEGFVLGLGVVEQADRREATAVVRTPLSSLDGVASLRIGAARWDWMNQKEV